MARKPNINLVAWFISLCVFIILSSILILRYKAAKTSSFHRLGSITLNVDGWSISHFVMYSLVGYTCHKTIWPFVIFGVGFEFLEEFIGMFNRKAGLDKKNDWFGQLSDPIVNTLGLLVGQSFGRKYNNDPTVTTKSHLAETCLLMGNFAIMWFAISETDKQFGISRKIKDACITGKKGIEESMGEFIDTMEMTPM